MTSSNFKSFKNSIQKILSQILFFCLKKRGVKKKKFFFFLSGPSLNKFNFNKYSFEDAHCITINNYNEVSNKLKSKKVILHDLIIFSPSEFFKRKKDIIKFLKKKKSKHFLTLKQNTNFLSVKEKVIFQTFKKKIIFCDKNNQRILNYAKKLKIKNLGNLNTLFFSLLFYIEKYNNVEINLVGCDGLEKNFQGKNIYFNQKYSFKNRINNIFEDMKYFDFYWPIFQFKFLKKKNFIILNLNKKSHYKSFKKNE